MRPFTRLLVIILAPFILFWAYTRYHPDSGFDIDLDIDLARYTPKNGYAWLHAGPGAAQCGPCGKGTTEFCEMMGPADMARTVSYAGSNDRMRRVLARMRSGKPFNVGVIGGSVSRGQGLGVDSKNNNLNMHRQIFDHLVELFPSPSGEVVINGDGKAVGSHGYTNGAQGGTGSDYFSLCFKEHIPEDVDLVLIELAINDEPLLRNQKSYELMVRALLDLPSQPAVINLHVFALMFATIANGGDQHSGIAQFYDLTVVSARNHLLPQVMADDSIIPAMFVPSNDKNGNNLNGVDLRHMGIAGHQLMANITNAYVDHQLCEMDRWEIQPGNSDKSVEELYPYPFLPRQMITQKYEPGLVVPKMQPDCFSTNAIKHKLIPKETSGWRDWNWKEKKYLIADEPGATVSFEFKTTSLGIVHVDFLRSATFGLGSVECWVDEDTDRKKVLEGYWNLPYNIGRLETIRNDLDIGCHILHCKLLQQTADPKGGHEFRLIGIMSI